jgi:DnaJ-class molecular chaperone
VKPAVVVAKCKCKICRGYGFHEEGEESQAEECKPCQGYGQWVVTLRPMIDNKSYYSFDTPYGERIR